jgi:hypothetical protein
VGLGDAAHAGEPEHRPLLVRGRVHTIFRTEKAP